MACVTYALTWHLGGWHNQGRSCTVGSHPWLSPQEELFARVFSAQDIASPHAYKVTARGVTERSRVQGEVVLVKREYHPVVYEIWLDQRLVVSYILTQEEPIRKLGHELKIYRREPVVLKVRDEMAEHYGLEPEKLNVEAFPPLRL